MAHGALGQNDLINGTWGSLTWTLNETTGELVISGTGEMDAFEYDSTSAWREYKSLIKSVTIKNGVTTIGEYAFSNCTSLTSVTIGDSVTTIGDYAFYNCTSLTSISVDENNPNYKSIDGNLYSKDGKTLVQYAPGKTETTFEILSGVTTIGDWAFRQCFSLTSIIIPDSVTTIGEESFGYCTSLTNIIIPDSVTTIGDWAFRGCYSLTSIVIPDSVTTIGEYAFGKCTSLTSISVDENNPNYKSIDGNLYSKDGKTLIQYAIGKTETIFAIPDSVTTIGYNAFSNCTSLTSVTIGDSVTTIGEESFFNCTSLTSIIIPDSVTTIGEESFFNCYSLTSVTIGNSVTTIGASAFSSCEGLTDVYYTGTKVQWNNIAIGTENGWLTNANIVYNYTGEEN